MAPVLTPPEIDRRPGRRDGDHGDIGTGNKPPAKPPADKRTGGNGDGDNWEREQAGSRGPRERLSSVRTGLFCFLAADIMFFVAIVSVFYVNKNSGHVDVYAHYINSWLPTVVPSILWLNTAVLLFSSATAEFARSAMFREADLMEEWLGLRRTVSRNAQLWLSVTLLLGALFLAGQWAAWDQLARQNVHYASNPSSKYFYLITVMHAVHLFAGIIALIATLMILRSARAVATRQVFVDGTVWYWHAMGLLWLPLFALLEWGQ